MSIKVKAGEAKTVQFTITDSDGAVDVSSATLSFIAKRKTVDADASAAITKANAAFTRSGGVYDENTGIVGLPLSTSDLAVAPGTYIGELKIIFTAGSNVDKSSNITIEIEPAVHDD